MKKNVLITGATGFLCSNIAQKFMADGYKVWGLTRNRSKSLELFGNNALWTPLFQDVCEPINTDCDFDYIIHGASPASPLLYKNFPVDVIKPNTIGTLRALECAAKCKAARLLFISSAAVYGERLKDACTENTSGAGNPLELRSCYEESKRMGENLVISFGHQFNIDTVILRPYHVYGPGMGLGDGRVISDFVENAIKREAIQIRGDGRTTRTLLYISDFVTGVEKVLFEGLRGEAYNIGNPYVELSTLEMAQTISELYGLKVNVNSPQRHGYLASPIDKMPINVSRLLGLGWVPTIEFKQGIRMTIEHARGGDEMSTYWL